MEFDWTYFVCALGLALVLEGAFYFLAADRLGPMLRMLAERPPSDLRKLGLTAVILGLLLVAWARAS